MTSRDAWLSSNRHVSLRRVGMTYLELQMVRGRIIQSMHGNIAHSTSVGEGDGNAYFACTVTFDGQPVECLCFIVPTTLVPIQWPIKMFYCSRRTTLIPIHWPIKMKCSLREDPNSIRWAYDNRRLLWVRYYAPSDRVNPFHRDKAPLHQHADLSVPEEESIFLQENWRGIRRIQKRWRRLTRGKGRCGKLSSRARWKQWTWSVRGNGNERVRQDFILRFTVATKNVCALGFSEHNRNFVSTRPPKKIGMTSMNENRSNLIQIGIFPGAAPYTWTRYPLWL